MQPWIGLNSALTLGKLLRTRILSHLLRISVPDSVVVQIVVFREHVGENILQALEPAALEFSLLAADDLEQERRRLDRNWHQRLERSRYEADQRTDVSDSRPGLTDAAWRALLSSIAVSAVALNAHFRLDASASPDAEFSAEALSVLVASGIIAVFLVQRAIGLDLTRWWPAPGIRSRIVRRRPFVWAYDRGLLLFGVALFFLSVLLFDEFHPVWIGLAAGVSVLLIQRLDPNPAKWQLTAPAEMTRNVEQATERPAQVLQRPLF